MPEFHGRFSRPKANFVRGIDEEKMDLFIIRSVEKNPKIGAYLSLINRRKVERKKPF
jgi:hypothetical protein